MDVNVSVELEPFDVFVIAVAPELTARLANVWLDPPLVMPLTANVPPPTVRAVLEATRLLVGEPEPVKSSVNVP